LDFAGKEKIIEILKNSDEFVSKGVQDQKLVINLKDMQEAIFLL
jgi:hypothetical protein